MDGKAQRDRSTHFLIPPLLCVVGAIPTRCIMRKKNLKQENERLKAELEGAQQTLGIYRTVLNRVSSKEIVQIEINKAFKELLCRRK